MRRHTEAVTALAVAHLVKSERAHRLLVQLQSIFAFVEAVANRMRTDGSAVLTLAEAKTVRMVLKIHVIVVLDDLFECGQRLQHRLTVVSEAALQPYRVFGWTQHCFHELGRRARALREFLVVVAEHGISVDPEDVPETLDGPRFGIINKVADKQTASLALDVPVVALCRACSRAACRADRRRLLAYELSATRTSGLIKVKKRAIAGIKCVVQLIS